MLPRYRCSLLAENRLRIRSTGPLDSVVPSIVSDALEGWRALGWPRVEITNGRGHRAAARDYLFRIGVIQVWLRSRPHQLIPR
jgi:hypothetical protein